MRIGNWEIFESDGSRTELPPGALCFVNRLTGHGQYIGKHVGSGNIYLLPKVEAEAVRDAAVRIVNSQLAVIPKRRRECT
jgi:hypothetical protein